MASHRFPFPRQTVRSVCLLFGLVAALAPAPAFAQSRLNRPPPRYFQLTPPDQSEGARILREMRAADLDGEYFLEFELVVLPRRGEERRIPGRLWGGRNRQGPITRICLVAPSADGGGAAERRLLVQGGPEPEAWQWPAANGSSGIAVNDAALFEPLAGTDLSAFDVQMPFLYWSDFVYEGKTRLTDRPVDTFLLYPPESLAAHRPDLAGVRVYLDPQYHALVRAEQIGEGERILKSFSLGGLVKVNERWMPKSFELRNEVTRDKTRLQVRSAALGLEFSSAVFAPGNLSDGMRPPTNLTRLPE